MYEGTRLAETMLGLGGLGGFRWSELRIPKFLKGTLEMNNDRNSMRSFVPRRVELAEMYESTSNG